MAVAAPITAKPEGAAVKGACDALIIEARRILGEAAVDRKNDVVQGVARAKGGWDGFWQHEVHVRRAA